MSLNFCNNAYTQDEFRALPEHVRQFHHNCLPWYCLMVDVGQITMQTIPVFLERLQMFSPSDYTNNIQNVCEKFGYESEQDFMKNFIGFTCNVATLSTQQFVKKLARVLEERGGKLGKIGRLTEEQSRNEMLCFKPVMKSAKKN